MVSLLVFCYFIELGTINFRAVFKDQESLRIKRAGELFHEKYCNELTSLMFFTGYNPDCWNLSSALFANTDFWLRPVI